MSQPHFDQVWGWSPTLGKVGDLESSGTPECVELNNKGQNTSHWGVFGVIEKVLKRRYRKWPHIWPFGHLQPKLWAKEGSGVKLIVWLPTIKSQESMPSRIWFECATWRWKDLDEGYNFGLDLVAIQLCSQVTCSQVTGVKPTWGFPKAKLRNLGLGSTLPASNSRKG